MTDDSGHGIDQIPIFFKLHQSKVQDWALESHLRRALLLLLGLHFRETIGDPEQVIMLLSTILPPNGSRDEIASSSSASNSSRNRGEIAWVFYFVGLLAMESKKLEVASYFLLNSYLNAQSNRLKLLALDARANVYKEAGKWEDAIVMLKESVNCAKSLELLSWQTLSERAVAIFKLASFLVPLEMFGQAAMACNCLGELAISAINRIKDNKSEHADLFVIGIHCRLMGHTACYMGDYEKSLEQNKRAVYLLKSLDIDPVQVPREQVLFTARCIVEAYVELQQVNLCLNKDKDVAEAVEDEMSYFFANSELVPEAEVHILEAKAYLAIRNGRLEEAEFFAAELLHKSTSQKTWLRIALRIIADITFEYQGETSQCKEMVESFLCEARRLCGDHPTRELQICLNEHATFLVKFSEFEQAREMLAQSLRMYMRTDMDKDKFGSFSEGRINYLEAGKQAFRNIQLVNFSFGQSELWRGVVWAERARARDLLHCISSGPNYYPGDDRTSGITDFDQDDLKAWEQIQSILCAFPEGDTAILVFSQLSSASILTYFLHENEPIESVICNLNPIPRDELDGELSEDEISNGISIIGMWKGLVSSTGNNESIKRMLESFYNIYISKWSSNLKRIRPKRMIIVPTEALYFLPWAAFRDPTDEETPYLIQKYEVVIIPSLRFFEHCEARRKSLLEDTQDRERVALVVQNPENEQQKELKNASKEGRIVARKLRAKGYKAVILKGADATKEAILEQCIESDWIHMTCHGVEGGNFGGNSKFPFGGLVASGRNGAVEEDTVITGDAMVRMKRAMKAMCVVLSACYTGRGKASVEGMLGLPRYLHLTGVPAAVVSLWDVDDAITTNFMKLLYQYLHQGLPLSTALQKTMVGILIQEDEFGFPVFPVRDWAAFTLSGSPNVIL